MRKLVDYIVYILAKYGFIQRTGHYLGSGYFTYSGRIGEMYGKYINSYTNPYDPRNKAFYDVPSWYVKPKEDMFRSF